MADNVMTFRYLVKEVALAEGARASFMPKPFAEYPGSAMHTHMSLFEGETNAFHSPDDPLQPPTSRSRSSPASSSTPARSARSPTSG